MAIRTNPVPYRSVATLPLVPYSQQRRVGRLEPASFWLFLQPKVAQHQNQRRTVVGDFQHSPAAAGFRMDSVRAGFDKKKGQSVTAKALISLYFLVGGAGFEPATPAV
jgi:hypothetical protein